MTPKIVVFSPTTHFLHTAAIALTGHGFQITPLKRLPDNLQEIEQLQPDLLIIDGENDFFLHLIPLVKALKTDWRLAYIGVIFTSGSDTLDEMITLPGVATSPASATALLECVQKMLSTTRGK